MSRSFATAGLLSLQVQLAPETARLGSRHSGWWWCFQRLLASEVVLVTLVVIYRVTFPISGELEFPPLRRRIDYRHHFPPPVSKTA